MMRNFFFPNKLFFLIIFCQAFVCEAFAVNQIPSKDNKINLLKAKNNNEIKIYERNEDEDKEEDSQVNDESTQSDSSDDGDFGIIKDIVEEEKVIEKNLDDDEDKIFLNKDIFIKKSKLKKGSTKIRVPDISRIKHLGFSQIFSLDEGIKEIIFGNKF